jgi:hypothetical protein
MNARTTNINRTIFHSRTREAGQGLVFSAISILLLVGFVALVYNIGRLTEKRTKIQIAADSAVYSGALVEANSLSTIAWINSAMAQAYYSSVNQGVNECAAATGTYMKWYVANFEDDAADPEWIDPTAKATAVMELSSLGNAYRDSRIQRGVSINWMQSLAQMGYTTALLSAKLAEDEMFAVARSMYGDEYDEDAADDGSSVPAGLRIATYPSFRLFPRGSGLWRALIKQLMTAGDVINGWLLINLETGEEIRLELINEEWYITWTQNGLSRQRYIFYEAPITEPGVKQQWEVRHEVPPGTPKTTIVIVEHEDLGWIIAEEVHDALGNRYERDRFSTKKVDMDGDPKTGKDGKEGTEISYKGNTKVMWITDRGETKVWNTTDSEYITVADNRQKIGPLDVTVNTVNNIDLGNGNSVRISNPTVVRMGPATITLAVPPRLHCSFGPIGISVRGFDAKTMNVYAGGHPLNVNSGDGLWQKWYNPIEDYWSRHRLTELDASDDVEAKRKWQYDYQTLGARMTLEADTDRFVRVQAFGQREMSGDPGAYNFARNFKPNLWFSPAMAENGPKSLAQSFSFTTEDHFGDVITRGSGSSYYRLLSSVPLGIYYQVDPNGCPKCGGIGCVNRGTFELPIWRLCGLCKGRCFDAVGDLTKVAVTLGDFHANAGNTATDFHQYILGLIPGFTAKNDIPVGHTNPADFRMPLVLNEEYFKYGIGMGLWHEKDVPMYFYRTSVNTGSKSMIREGENIEPDWGFLAIASARIAFPDDGGWVARFEDSDGRTDPDARDDWLESKYNLYAADIRPRLIAIKKQVADDAFDEDIITAGIRLNEEQHDSSVTYIFDVLTRSGRGVYGNTMWRFTRKDETDARIGTLLRDMGRSNYDLSVTSPKDGGIRFGPRSRVNVRNPDLEEIVHH